MTPLQDRLLHMLVREVTRMRTLPNTMTIDQLQEMVVRIEREIPEPADPEPPF